jgi:hypothetical protein
MGVPYILLMIFWTLRPDIELPNIKAKLPENHINIFLSGRNALSINASGR